MDAGQRDIAAALSPGRFSLIRRVPPGAARPCGRVCARWPRPWAEGSSAPYPNLARESPPPRPAAIGFPARRAPRAGPGFGFGQPFVSASFFLPADGPRLAVPSALLMRRCQAALPPRTAFLPSSPPRGSRAGARSKRLRNGPAAWPRGALEMPFFPIRRDAPPLFNSFILPRIPISIKTSGPILFIFVNKCETLFRCCTIYCYFQNRMN